MFKLANPYMKDEPSSFHDEPLSDAGHSRLIPRDTFIPRDTMVADRKVDTKISIPNAINSKVKDANAKSMLENMFGGLRKNNLVDADGPAKENWEFCIFEVRKKKYHVFKNGINEKLNIPLGPEDETLIM